MKQLLQLDNYHMTKTTINPPLLSLDVTFLGLNLCFHRQQNDKTLLYEMMKVLNSRKVNVKQLLQLDNYHMTKTTINPPLLSLDVTFLVLPLFS